MTVFTPETRGSHSDVALSNEQVRMSVGRAIRHLRKSPLTVRVHLGAVIALIRIAYVAAVWLTL